MATIVTRSGKGSPLTNTEVDANLTNLNTDKLEISGGTMTGDLSLGDNNKAIFGSGSELEIYSDGTSGIIKDVGAGDIKILADDFYVQNAAGNSTLISVLDTGKVGLGFAGSEKLATESGGVNITGTLTSDGLTVDGTPVRINSTAPMLHFMETGVTDSNHRIRQNAGNLYFQKLSDDENTETTRMVIDGNGFTGFGTSSPAFPLDVATNSSTTNDGVVVARLSANTTGTAANNFGAALNFSAEDASGALRDLATINGIYTDATNRSSALTFKTRSNLGALTTQMTLDALGNLGIGTSSIDGTLHLDAGTSTDIIIEKDNAGYGALRFHNDGSQVSYILLDNAEDMTYYGGSGVKHIFYAGGAATMTLDSGKVGIGSQAPLSLLDLTKTTAGFITGGSGNKGAVLTLHHEAQWENGYTGGDWLGALDFSTGDSSGGEGIRTSIRTTVDTYFNTNSLAFYTCNQGDTTLDERMRLTAAGDLLLGKTSANGTSASSANDGLEIRPTFLSFQANTIAAYFNTRTDGTILSLQKDGQSVGSISTSGGDMIVGTGTSRLNFFDATPAILPSSSETFGSSDGAIDLGNDGRRFKDFYLSGTAHVGNAAIGANATKVNFYSDSTYSGIYNGSSLTSDESIYMGGDAMFFYAGAGERLRITSSDVVFNNDRGLKDFRVASGSENHMIFVDASNDSLGIGSAAQISGTAPRMYVHNDSTGVAIETYRNTSTASAVVQSWYSDVGATQTKTAEVEANGDFENTNNSYSGLSDQRLKQDIVDAASQWDDIKALQVRKYRFINHVETMGDDATVQLGVIAQELEASGMNGLVKTKPIDEADPDGPDRKSVNYSVLYMKAVKALQEAMVRIETLETKVAALEKRT